jgi:hypothetical protein
VLSSILDAAERIAGGADPAATLDQNLPRLVEQMRSDARAGRFAAWGESTVVDENTEEPVITQPLFDELHRIAGLPAAWPVGNAGLVHVYGYLLSTAQTPFGGKRDRWTGGGVARALDRDPEEFAPWFPATTTPLERLAAAIAPVLADPAALPGTVLWMEEGTSPAAATVVVRGASGEGALLYAVGGRLITAFPVGAVTSDWVGSLLTGEPRLRYTAVVGAAKRPLGERRVRLHRQ